MSQPEGWEGRVQVGGTHRKAISLLWQDQSSSSCQFCCHSCCLIGQAGKGWGTAHGQNESAQGLFLVPRQTPSGQRKLSHAIFPSTGSCLSHTEQHGPSQAGVLPPHNPTEAIAPPPQIVAGSLPAIADGTSSLANEPAGFNSYLPLALIRVSLGHSSLSITSLRLWHQDVNPGPPLGWPPSSQPPSEGCCLTVPQVVRCGS